MTTIDPTGKISVGTIPEADLDRMIAATIPPADTGIEQFRVQLRAVDPAALSKEDRLALLDLFRQSIPE